MDSPSFVGHILVQTLELLEVIISKDRYWNLDSLNKMQFPANLDYLDDTMSKGFDPKKNGVSLTGAGIDIVILDTGVNENHPHFHKNGVTRVKPIPGYVTNTTSSPYLPPGYPNFSNEPDGSGNSHGTVCALAAAGAGASMSDPGGLGPGVAKEANIYSGTSGYTEQETLDVMQAIIDWKTVGSSTADAAISNPTVISISQVWDAETGTLVVWHSDQLGGNRIAMPQNGEKWLDLMKSAVEPDNYRYGLGGGDGRFLTPSEGPNDDPLSIGYRYPIHIVLAAGNSNWKGQTTTTGGGESKWSPQHAALSPEELSVDGISITAKAGNVIEITWPKEHFIPNPNGHASSLAPWKGYLNLLKMQQDQMMPI